MPAPAILPFLPAIASGVGELIGGIGNIKASKRQADLYGRLSDQAKAQIPGLEKKVDQYSIGPSMRRLRQMATEDPLGDIQRQELQRSQATGVGALKSGGSKSLFALPSLMQGMDSSRRKIDADAFGRMKSALTTVGQAEENVGARKFRQTANDLGLARKQSLGYELDKFGAEQARRDSITGMVQGGLSTLGSLAAAGAFGDGSGIPKNTGVELNEGDTAFERIMGRSAFPEQTEPEGYSFMGNYSGLNQNNSPFSDGYDFGFNIPQFGSAPNIAAGIYRSRQGERAQGGRTRGAFNHDTNDMKIVDKNGSHTGMSVTGDEVVLNPQQQKNIAKQSSYFRSLMKTPRFR